MGPLKRRSHTVIKEYAEVVKSLNVLVRRIILFVALIVFLLREIVIFVMLLRK